MCSNLDSLFSDKHGNSVIITLTADSEKYVRAKIDSGEYSTPEEIVDLALRILRYEDWKKEVRRKIDEGWAQAKAGHMLTPEEVQENLAQRKAEILAARAKQGS